MIKNLLHMSSRLQLLQEKNNEIQTIEQDISSMKKSNSLNSSQQSELKKQIDEILEPYYQDEKQIDDAIRTLTLAEDQLQL